MERSKEELKQHVLKVIDEDIYFEKEELKKLKEVIENDEKLTKELKVQLEELLNCNLEKELRNTLNQRNVSLLLEVDCLSIYSDAYGEYCLKRG